MTASDKEAFLEVSHSLHMEMLLRGLKRLFTKQFRFSPTDVRIVSSPPKGRLERNWHRPRLENEQPEKVMLDHCQHLPQKSSQVERHHSYKVKIRWSDSSLFYI